METKTQIKHILVLFFMYGAIGFASCSGGEKNIDDVLSKETTPVTFELGADEGYVGCMMFDYTANGTYLRSDTIPREQQTTPTTIDLRQGNHQLIWITARKAWLHPSNAGVYFYNGQIDGLRFIPSERTIQIGYLSGYDIQYWQKQIEVSPWLLPAQKANYSSATCALHINITDFPPSIEQPSDWSKEIGKIFLPYVSEVGLADKRYKLKSESGIMAVYYYPTMMGTHRCRPIDYYSLCPLNGLDNIQLTCSITDDNGQPVSTTPLPKISFRRGYVTKIYGPLFSGSISDWKVEMEPFNYDN